MANVSDSYNSSLFPSLETWVLLIVICACLPINPFTISLQDLVIDFSAQFQAGGAYASGEIDYDIKRWVVAAIFINIFSILYALKNILFRKPKEQSFSLVDILVFFFFGVISVISIGFLLFMFYPKADFTVMVFVTFLIYAISDVVGIHSTRSKLVESIKYRYNLFSLEIPALLVLFLILGLNFLFGFDKDKLVFLSSGEMIVTSIAYAFVNQYVVKHAEDNLRSFQEQIAQQS